MRAAESLHPILCSVLDTSKLDLENTRLGLQLHYRVFGPLCLVNVGLDPDAPTSTL